jgi:hypothetical protein
LQQQKFQQSLSRVAAKQLDWDFSVPVEPDGHMLRLYAGPFFFRNVFRKLDEVSGAGLK